MTTEHSAQIEYFITSTVCKSYDCGITSLSGRHEQTSNEQTSKGIEIAVVPFTDYHMFQLILQAPHISEVYLVDRDTVLLESFDTTFSSWLVRSHKIWYIQQSESVDIRGWWKHIKPNFILIFRDILKGCRSLHKKNSYCSNLADNVVLLVDKKDMIYSAKIKKLDMAQNDNDHDTRKRLDIKQIRDMMIAVLLMPFETIDEEDLTRFGLDTSLLNFLESMNHVENIDSSIIGWILDEPFFWTATEKTNFIRKLWYKISLSEGRDFFRMADAGLSDLVHWEGGIVGVRANEVLNYMKDLESKYLRDTQKSPCTSPFTRTVCYYRNLLHHFDDKEKFHEDSLDRISEYADSLIGGVGSLCSVLHAALTLVGDHVAEMRGIREYLMSEVSY